MRDEGGPLPKDPSEALRLFERACEGKINEACKIAAQRYVLTAGKDQANAVELLTRACQLDAGTCEDLGRLYDLGRSVPKDEARALELYAQACTAGTSSSCLQLCAKADLHELGGKPLINEARALDLQQLACDKPTDANVPHDCCETIANRYTSGRGRPRDDAIATRYYLRACISWPRGCDLPAERYERGLGVAKDVVKALELYVTACEDLVASACLKAAKIHRSGAVPNDNEQAEGYESKAVSSYEMGCENGSAEACDELSKLHAKGELVPKSGARAAKYRALAAKEMRRMIGIYRDGCAHGTAFYCHELGLLYQEGRWLPRDRARASALFEKACAGGTKAACK